MKSRLCNFKFFVGIRNELASTAHIYKTKLYNKLLTLSLNASVPTHTGNELEIQ